MKDLYKCLNYDSDCPGVKNKWACWLYKPDLGYCPYIQSHKNIKKKRLKETTKI